MSRVISEVRIVQEIRDSYVIYLPKEWCKNNNITRGSKILLKGRDKRLSLEPLVEEDKIHDIFLEDFNERIVKYVLISLYVLGHRSIRLIFKRPIATKDRRVLKNILRLLKGFEIYEEGKNYFIIREISGLSELRHAILKEFNTVLNLIETLEEILSTYNERLEDIKIQDILDSLEELDTEIDISRLEIKRLFNKILEDLSLDPGIDHKILTGLVFISSILERIGDHIVSVIRIVGEKNIRSQDLSDSLKYIKKTSNVISRDLDIIFRALQSEDYSKYLKERLILLLEELTEIIDLKSKFREEIYSNIGVDKELLSYHIMRVFDYLTDIAEYLIDILIEIYVSY
ncbi:MAG: PhoU domain-containing protein [Sulfolobales archaeon]